MNERNVKTLNDLPAVAAGLSVQNTASNRNDTTFSIRGQGQTFGQNSPGVVTYFADVPDFGKQFFDLENVQVLKGPQGTLDRKRVVQGKRVSVCIDLGGRRIIKMTNNKMKHKITGNDNTP